jgi:hypothetical protein
LTIENTGSAIPPTEITRLFQPFQQLSSQATTTGGLGLGLTLTKSIADAHHAVVKADARSGGGLRVQVEFPPAPTPRTETAQPESRREPTRASKQSASVVTSVNGSGSIPIPSGADSGGAS